MPAINLRQANEIVSAALEKARELALKPLCVAVLDAGGHLVALQRQDRASLLRPEIAIGKAASALALGISSRKIAEMASERPTFVTTLAHISQKGIIPAAGGVLIVSDGEIVGAVGVTGDTSDHDEICALAGIAAAGMTASE